MWEGVGASATNPKQLSSNEKAMLARTFYKQGKAVKDIAAKLRVSDDAVYNWTQEILRKQKDARNALIVELYLRCWTEQQIAKEVGLKQPQVHSTIIGFCKNTKNDNPPSSLRFWNLWEFEQADDSYGDKDFPGRMPGQVVENLLWYYTQPLQRFGDGKRIQFYCAVKVHILRQEFEIDYKVRKLELLAWWS